MPGTYTAEQLMGYLLRTPPDQRGLNVYRMTELETVSAIAKNGKRLNVTYQRPRFTLTPEERVQIARFSSMIFGIVNSRAQRAGSLEWNVVADSVDIERESARMNDLRDIWTEYEDLAATRPGVIIMRMHLYRYLKKNMPDLREDLGNFRQAHQRWIKRAKGADEDRASEAEAWLERPNEEYSFGDAIKKWVLDLQIHGAHAIYKEPLNGVLENWYGLPGGMVLPVHTRRIGGITAYLQFEESPTDAQVYFGEEVCFSRWIPNTAMSYGFVPLEALVNKVAEQLLFDQLAADQADGTKPPEKMLVMGKESPFGDLDGDMRIPLPVEEQKKVETVVNEKRQNAIRVISGYGKPFVLDLTRGDVFGHQSDRQRQLKEDAALVFGATPLEMNLAGSADTSGRSTSESQERMEQKRGLNPILQVMTEKINREILPFRYGYGYKFQFASGLSEGEQVDLWIKKQQSKLYSTNEIRTEDMGKDPYPEEQYNRPAEAQAGQGPGETMNNPFFMSPVND